MNIDIKSWLTWLKTKISAHPVFIRVLTQVVVFITTFGWHNSSDFWHIICVASMGLMAIFSVSDGKLRKANIQNGEQVVEILQDAISNIAENCDIDISDVFDTSDTSGESQEETQTKAESETAVADDVNSETITETEPETEFETEPETELETEPVSEKSSDNL